MRPSFVLALAALALVAAPRPGRAQATRNDSAATLLDAARRFDAEGNREAAAAMWDQILRRFADTPAGAEARARLAARPGEGERSGRLEMMAWGGIHGAWLGLAVPGALGAEGRGPYSLGLIFGAPLGVVAGKLYADAAHPTLGQARAMTLGFRLGTWQTVGWLTALTKTDLSTEAILGSMVLGGIGGEAAAAIYTRHRSVSVGVVTAASHGAEWGTWFGLMGWPILGLEGDAGLAFALAATDVGLLAAVATAPRDISSGRVWLTTAAGIAGAAMGAGMDLFIQPGEEKVALLIPVLGSAVGLGVGIAMSKGVESVRGAEAPAREPPALALLQMDEAGTRVSLPMPTPTLVQVGERGPQPLYRPALAVSLFRATFQSGR
jgi:hypothetical protein